MAETTQPVIDYKTMELDGIRYVILRETAFELLCQRAQIKQQIAAAGEDPSQPGLELDRASLADKLVRRRRASGLSQAKLARLAGVRPETLNRIERGRTTPDFATIRKLVIAINAAEREDAALPALTPSCKETENVDQE